jgi:hypothetical protein
MYQSACSVVKTVATPLVKAEMLSAPMEMLSAPMQSSLSNDRAVKAEWAEVVAKKRADATARRVKYYCDDLQSTIFARGRGPSKVFYEYFSNFFGIRRTRREIH